MSIIVIIGFMIVGEFGFIPFEHYFENFHQYIKDKQAFFDFMDSTGYKIGTYSFEKVTVKIVQLTESTVVGVVYLSSKELQDVRLSQLLQIANKVSVADKETTHEVLKSRYSSDILH